MKRILAVNAVWLCCVSSSVLALTGPDPGAPDSIWLDPVPACVQGDTTFTTTLYTANDEPLKHATIVLAWTSPQIGIDSVSLIGSRWQTMVTGGNGFFVADTGLVDGVLTPTRYNISFLPFTSLLSTGSGAACQIYWHRSGPPPASDTLVVVDTSTTSSAPSVRNSTLFGTSSQPADNFVPAFVPDTIHVCPCLCGHQGDPNGNGLIDVLDVVALVDRSFGGATCTKDPICPAERCDFNGDGATDVLDVVAVIDYAFSGGPPPAAICAP